MVNDHARRQIVLRPAEAGDVGAIAALHAESWRSAYRGLVPDPFLGPALDGLRLSAWRDRFASPEPDRRMVVAAWAGDLLVGFTCMLADAEPAFGPLLDNLHVRPGWRGMGLGARLLNVSREWARDIAPAQPMHLWVIEANTGARRFYRAQGAREGERRVNDMAGIEVTAVRCTWPPLPPALTR
jgi:GNAT superfamily N-acetyltransferase